MSERMAETKAGTDCFERAIAWSARLFAGKAVSTSIICELAGVSRATAKRDMQRLEQLLPVVRDGRELRLMPT